MFPPSTILIILVHQGQDYQWKHFSRLRMKYSKGKYYLSKVPDLEQCLVKAIVYLAGG